MKKFIVSLSVVFILCLSVVLSVSAADEQNTDVHNAYVASDGVEIVSEENTILDSGSCGENLYWELNSEGLLRIFGEGPMYDYNKYMEPSPWYKYRDEPYISEDGLSILDKNGGEYLPTTDYYDNNPNGYKIQEIIIEEGITYIGDWAFYRVCVEEITVPETVEATGIFCFRYSPTLKVLNLPNSLKFLDDYAISRNYDLEVLNLGNSLETVGTAGFNNNPALKKIILPDTCTSINKQQSPTYASIDYSKVGLMENCSSLEYVSFGSVTEIPQRTCLGAALETVVIPNTVKSIGSYAFYSCSSLKDVTFEEGSVCTEINSTAFTSCSSLERIKGGVSLEKLGLYTSFSSLAEFDFSSTNKELLKNQFLGTSLKEVSVSNNIEVIPVSCFNNMKKLEKIYLPNTLTEIMGSSFNYCESLKDIYFDGTRAQWGSIKKASGWNYKVNPECMLHFSDGTSVSLWYTPIKYTVTFMDYNGTVLATQQVQEGCNATAPEVSEREGYLFTGWDIEFSFITADTVVTAKYTQITAPTGKLSLYVIGGTGFRISVNGGNARVQGPFYRNTKMSLGAAVTLVANVTDDAEFLGWMNEAGAVVSKTETFEFYTTGNDHFTAVYKTDIEGVNVVTFKNSKALGGNGQIFDMQYYVAGDEITFPDAPTLTGYSFVAWNLTEDEIQAKLAAGEDVTVDATWEIAKTYVNVSVKGGTVSTQAQENGQYLAFNACTVVADEALAGQKFAYWTDAQGKVVSYKATYKFFPAADVELTAVFVAEDTVVELRPLLTLSGNPTSYPDEEKITYTLSWDVDASIGTVTGVGVIIVDKADYNEATFVHGTTDSKVFDRAFANKVAQSGEYAPNKSASLYDHTYVAAMWIQYKDAVTGNTVIVYSHIIEVYKPAV